MTNAELAAALGVAVRTIERYRSEGMPLPAEGEKLPAWSKRATKWRSEQRRLPGPRKRKTTVASSAGLTGSLEEKRAIETELMKLRLAVEKGELHSAKQCHEEFVRRLQELTNAFKRLPDTLARAVYQAPSPDAIKVRVEEELRRIFEVLSRD